MPTKRTKPTIEQRVEELEFLVTPMAAYYVCDGMDGCDCHACAIDRLMRRLDYLESARLELE